MSNDLVWFQDEEEEEEEEKLSWKCPERRPTKRVASGQARLHFSHPAALLFSKARCQWNRRRKKKRRKKKKRRRRRRRRKRKRRKKKKKRQ